MPSSPPESASPAIVPPAVEPRRRILDEAAALFLERGYDGTSLRDLAERVGMKAGSLYYHFDSKDDLLRAILSEGIEVMHAAFDEARAETESAPPETRFGAHVRAHLGALYENGPYTAAHVTTFRTAPVEVTAAIVPIRDAYEARWTALLEDLADEGAISPDVHLGVLRLTLMGAMNASVEWFDTERGNLDRFAAQVTKGLWNGIT